MNDIICLRHLPWARPEKLVTLTKPTGAGECDICTPEPNNKTCTLYCEISFPHDELEWLKKGSFRNVAISTSL